jgi:hypothetical protein
MLIARNAHAQVDQNALREYISLTGRGLRSNETVYELLAA